MKTAIKVINDRINILEKYLTDTNDDDSPSSRRDRGQASWAKDLFTELLSVVNSYTEFLKSGVNNEDLVNKIRELLSQTMIPLVERNKEMIDSYKQMMFNLSEKAKAIEIAKPEEAQRTKEEREEISYLNTMLIEYDKVKKDTVEYLEEYETGLEEIKELVIGGEAMEIADRINPHPHAPVEPSSPSSSSSPEQEYQHEPVVHEHRGEEQQPTTEETEAEQIEPFVFRSDIEPGESPETAEPGGGGVMSDEDADKNAEEQMKKLFKERVKGQGGQGNDKGQGNEQFPA